MEGQAQMPYLPTPPHLPGGGQFIPSTTHVFFTWRSACLCPCGSPFIIHQYQFPSNNIMAFMHIVRARTALQFHSSWRACGGVEQSALGREDYASFLNSRTCH